MNEPANASLFGKMGLKSGDIKIALLGGRLVGLMALSALVVRFVSVPSDFGGCFFQVWMSMVGTAGFAVLLGRLKVRQRVLACCILIPCLAICFFGPIYFAPQALFPFFFAAAAVGGSLWLWSQSMTIPALLAALLLLPFGGCCGHGINHMALLSRFKGFKGTDLREIRLEPVDRGGQSIVVRDAKALDQIAGSLHSTSPYSPNHESIGKSWEMILIPVNGLPIHCRVGKGNQAHPETGWIRFGVEDYQNPELPKALVESAGLREFSQ
jgi:hypothetical protein